MEPSSIGAAFSWLKKIGSPIWKFIFQRVIDNQTLPLKEENATLKDENLALKRRIRDLEEKISCSETANADYNFYEPIQVSRGVTVYRDKRQPVSDNSCAFFCAHCYESRKGIFTIQTVNLLWSIDKRACSNCGYQYIISAIPKTQKHANTDYNLFGD